MPLHSLDFMMYFAYFWCRHICSLYYIYFDIMTYFLILWRVSWCIFQCFGVRLHYMGGGGCIRTPNFHFPQFLTPYFLLSTIFYPLISTFHNFLPPDFHFPHFEGKLSISWVNLSIMLQYGFIFVIFWQGHLDGLFGGHSLMVIRNLNKLIW